MHLSVICGLLFLMRDVFCAIAIEQDSVITSQILVENDVYLCLMCVNLDFAITKMPEWNVKKKKTLRTNWFSFVIRMLQLVRAKCFTRNVSVLMNIVGATFVNQLPYVWTQASIRIVRSIDRLIDSLYQSAELAAFNYTYHRLVHTLLSNDLYTHQWNERTNSIITATNGHHSFSK